MKPRRYEESFKSQAVKLALSGELTYAEVARDLGLNDKILCQWIRQTMDKPKPFIDKDKIPSKQDYQSLERHNNALQKELDLRKKEIEFLKKASAYFASLK